MVYFHFRCSRCSSASARRLLASDTASTTNVQVIQKDIKMAAPLADEVPLSSEASFPVKTEQVILETNSFLQCNEKDVVGLLVTHFMTKNS